MLVDAKKVKLLRLEKNWTQQHLADVCDLSMRTIQRVEKDGVASNETVSAYAAIFELRSSDIILTPDEFEHRSSESGGVPRSGTFLGVLFLGGITVGVGAGIGLALFLF
jgi:transcriptional regulator with XRE-family HTH domain